MGNGARWWDVMGEGIVATMSSRSTITQHQPSPSKTTQKKPHHPPPLAVTQKIIYHPPPPKIYTAQKWSFPLSISLTNVTKSAGNWIWSHLLTKSLMENFISCAVIPTISHHQPGKKSATLHYHPWPHKFSHLDIPCKIILTVSWSFCGKLYIENLIFSVKKRVRS